MSFNLYHGSSLGIIMNLYEHVFILRQDISNTQVEEIMSSFEKVLEDNKGKVKNKEYWGMRSLAYRINKNRKGHYCFFNSESPSDAVKEMERLMKIHEDVLRVLTVKVKEHQEGPSIMLQSKAKNDEKMARKLHDL